jgi:hypothetical protein
MIIVVSSPALSHSTDPTAAAVTAGFRPASPTSASLTEKAPACSGQFDVDRLYPNLSATEQPARPTGPIAHIVEALRHAALL